MFNIAFKIFNVLSLNVYSGQRMDDLDGKEILLGTYEAFILGYKLAEDKKSLVS